MAVGRYGTALMAVNTQRPPDLERGADVEEVELATPPVVAAQVAQWEKGARGPVDPREAASLLWRTEVAAYLDGRADAWLDVPGVRTLLPGWQTLEATDRSSWPATKKALRTLVAAEAPGGPTPEELVAQLRKERAVEQLNDLVLLFKYTTLGARRPLRETASLFRLVSALLSAGNWPATREAVIAALEAPLAVPRVFAAPLDENPKPPPADGGGRPPRGPRLPMFDLATPHAAEALRRLHDEIDEIDRRRDTDAMVDALRAGGVDETLIGRATGRLPGRDRPEAVLGVSAGAAGEPAGARPVVGASSASVATQPYRVRIVRSHIAGIPVLLDVAEAQARLLRLRSTLAERLTAALPATVTDRLRDLGIDVSDLTIWPDLVTAATHVPSYLEPVGRSDLLLVRQTTTGYRRAEIAYVENILIGEERAREHTVRTLSREETFTVSERETEETQDLQVTDRGELSREVSSVVEEDMQASGSVEVTSRGPTQIVATGEASFERSTEEAAKAVEKYSRETIERAVKRTLEKVRREVRRLFEQELLEFNKHGFKRDGNAADHVTGVYQYLERVSRARIFWYGERELYDLLVPEPAALVWQQAVAHKELQIALQPPDHELFDSLTLDNIADLRDEIIAAFRVMDLPALPDETRNIGVPISATGRGDEAKYTAVKEVQVPDGYAVVGALFVISAEVEDSDDEPNGGIAVGDQVHLWTAPIVSGNQGSATHDFLFSDPLPGPTVAVAMNADNFTSLAGTVNLKLELTDDGRLDWALAAYARVADRYEQLRREYEQAVIEASTYQATENVTLPVGSRERLERIVRTELQRSAIDLMRNAPVDTDLITDFAYVGSDGAIATHPVADIPELRAAEPEIRFLQQAFEWEHMSWILYPYFWGRRSEWGRKVAHLAPDPDFAAFLDAGAARLQVPVRPGFEAIVKHYMETGEVYGGDGLPKMGDEGYLPFIAEQLTTLSAPGDEIPWPPDEPREWDIVSPTSLVLVRSANSDPVPTWDPATGDETN
jgi:hypothetical protein